MTKTTHTHKTAGVSIREITERDQTKGSNQKKKYEHTGRIEKNDMNPMGRNEGDYA
ncbi:MAG: hypothetical protein GY757_59285 [bacterium]|nr:hypothetical protein [bacterium]